MIRTLSATLVLAFATSALHAQATVTVGPAIAPLGCDIWITLSNDTASTIVYGDGCPYTVWDSNGGPVKTYSCPLFAPVFVQPGQTSEFIPWDQTDDMGNPVAPGLYIITVDYNGVPSNHTVVIGGDDVGVSQLGAVKIGTFRHIGVCAPMVPNGFYFLGAAFTSTVGFPACNEIFPLDIDALFLFATGPNGVFFDLFGPLDAAGASKLPGIATPNDPMLVGLSFELAAVVFDFSLPCPVAGVSSVVPVTIQ